MRKPRVSVITICYQAERELAVTVPSVTSQTYADFEYVIIDGGSTDGTLQFLQAFRSKIQLIVTEKDRGIYDAMNKGVRLSRGDFVIFMNAGDRFYSETSLAEAVSLHSQTGGDLFYGDTEIRYEGGFQRIDPAKPVDHLSRGTVFCHQSVFAKRELLQRFPFDLQLKITADYDFTLKAFSSGAIVTKVPLIVSSVTAGGVSDRKRLQTIRSQWKLSASHFGWIKTSPVFMLRMLKAVLTRTLNSVIPPSLILPIKMKWHRLCKVFS